jgi:hypothetical protein
MLRGRLRDYDQIKGRRAIILFDVLFFMNGTLYNLRK